MFDKGANRVWTVHGLVSMILVRLYHYVQVVIAICFAPRPPPLQHQNSGPRIAIIGAGITGVSSAAHCVGHGCEATIFEAGPREHLGGIWARVNETSSLQVHSLMYRFHPTVRYSEAYPTQSSIIHEVTKLWKTYHLDERTLFNTRVNRVWKEDGKWYVNSSLYGAFDGVLAAVGTCGEPIIPRSVGMDQYCGEIHHSSNLTGKNMKGRRVIVVGGGASALEAVEHALSHGAEQAIMLVRNEKWIAPRNLLFNLALAANFWGYHSTICGLVNCLLQRFHYREFSDMSPKKGFYTDTPMTNNGVFDLIRKGKLQWYRGDIKSFSADGIVFNHRSRDTPEGSPGKEITVRGHVCVMATGFRRPSLGFLPDDCFKPPYQHPNWYLTAFPPGRTDICATNCTYVSAVGTVGNMHIGIFARLLLMFASDAKTRPSKQSMRNWFDLIRISRMGAPTKGLEFFTYSEMILWLEHCLLSSQWRWRWIAFVLLGWGDISSS